MSLGKNAAFSQRYIIEGSDTSDGVYAGEVGTPQLRVSGSEWRLRPEWNNKAGSGWQPSRVRRVGVR